MFRSAVDGVRSILNPILDLLCSGNGVGAAQEALNAFLDHGDGVLGSAANAQQPFVAVDEGEGKDLGINVFPVQKLFDEVGHVDLAQTVRRGQAENAAGRLECLTALAGGLAVGKLQRNGLVDDGEDEVVGGKAAVWEGLVV